jgi:8-oxo-dGTP diphosphatase
MQAVAEQGYRSRTEGAAAGSRAQVWVTLVILAVREGQVFCLLEPGAPAADGQPRGALPVTTPQDPESLDDAARRVLAIYTLPNGYLEQLRAWAESPRAGGERVIEIGYVFITPFPPTGMLAGEAVGEPTWWPISGLPQVAPAHQLAIQQALTEVRDRLPRTNLAWSLLPEEFSLSDLQTVYEAVEQRPLDKRNFRKWVLTNGLVEPTARLRRDGAHRPARLYRFADRPARILG